MISAPQITTAMLGAADAKDNDHHRTRSKPKPGSKPNLPPGAGRNNSSCDYSYKHTVERHYYTPERRFEQSLDVYRPTNPRGGSGGGGSGVDSAALPVVVLVMGSGWLGHRPYFYRVTNWWNSAAPKQICGNLGYPCVSIRHSGGYLFGERRGDPRGVSNWPWLLPWAIAAAVLVAEAAFPGSVWNCLLPRVLVLSLLSLAGASEEWTATVDVSEASVDPLALAVMALPVMVAILRWEGAGAAQIDDMVRDVRSALNYLDAHADELGLGMDHLNNSSSNNGNNNNNNNNNSNSNSNSNKLPIVFGGYSSGAHVAATLLMGSPLSPLRSGSSRDGEFPKLECLSIVSILYVSGVLDVPEASLVMRLLSRIVLRSHAAKVPSPLRKLRSGDMDAVLLLSSSHEHEHEHEHEQPKRNNECDNSCLAIPPHVLIGCRNEVFGWSVLDNAFCSRDYAFALRKLHRSRSAVPGLVETSSSESDSNSSLETDEDNNNSSSSSSSSSNSNNKLAIASSRDICNNSSSNSSGFECDEAFVKLILLDGWSVNHWSILSSSEFREALGTVLTELSSKQNCLSLKQ